MLRTTIHFYCNTLCVLFVLQICEKVQSEGYTVVKDPENRMGPYAYKGQEWFSYDDRATIKQKVKMTPC